jgi:hypothetical protein
VDALASAIAMNRPSLYGAFGDKLALAPPVPRRCSLGRLAVELICGGA